MLLTGTFRRSLDEKLRFGLPKGVRDALGEPTPGVFYIAPATDGALVLYTAEIFEQLATRLSSAPPTREDVRAFRRLFYTQAERVDVDRQGRIRVPPRLAKMAGLGKEAVLLGVHDHMELWDEQRWAAYVQRESSRFDAIAESAFGATSDGGKS